MGGAGDLLSLALNVPPWEDLHELSRNELRSTNLVTTDLVAEVLPQGKTGTPVAASKGQERFADKAEQDQPAQKSTRTAEALPSNTVAATPAQ
jgi:hypothetical protein